MVTSTNKYQIQIKIMKEFRDQLIRFLDELIEQFPKEGDFVLIRIFIKDQIPMVDVIGRFIRDLLPLRKQVEERNESFFLQNTILYTGASISAHKVDHFKQLWTSTLLDQTDRDIIWSWMDLFIKLAQRYHDEFGYVEGWEPIA